MPIEIHVLGIGEAFDPQRPNSSSVIKAEDHHLLIDCGASIPPILWRDYPEPNKIDSIYFTHLHPDHCFGLGPMLIWWMDRGRTKPLNIYTTQPGKKQLEALISTALWGISDQTSYPIHWHDIKATERIGPFQAKFGKTIHSVLNHSIRLEHEASVFFYSGDGIATKASRELMRDVNLCFHECYSIEPSPVHFNLGDALEMFAELSIPQMCLYHLCVGDFTQIQNAIEPHPHVRLAEAGERIVI